VSAFHGTKISADRRTSALIRITPSVARICHCQISTKRMTQSIPVHPVTYITIAAQGFNRHLPARDELKFLSPIVLRWARTRDSLVRSLKVGVLLHASKSRSMSLPEITSVSGSPPATHAPRDALLSAANAISSSEPIVRSDLPVEGLILERRPRRILAVAFHPHADHTTGGVDACVE
jgi:hypothetical protein